MTKQLTDIEIAKKLVKEQEARRRDNFKEQEAKRSGIKEQRKDWQKRLQDNKYI